MLDPADLFNQRRPVGELNRLDPSYAVPAVLTGDFNARSNENRPVYREHLTRLRADGWRNSESLARHDTTQVPGASTLNGFGATIDGRWYYRQISRTGTDYDYVWVRKGAGGGYLANRARPGGASAEGERAQLSILADGPVPSDHCPVLAHITV